VRDKKEAALPGPKELMQWGKEEEKRKQPSYRKVGLFSTTKKKKGGENGRERVREHSGAGVRYILMTHSRERGEIGWKPGIGLRK